MKIILENCGKNYHKNWLYRNISIDIDLSPGNSYSILGQNGSGKSTFTLMLTGQVAPTEGSISWESNNGIQISVENWNRNYALSSPAMELPEEFTLEDWFEFQNQIKPFNEDITLNSIIELCEFKRSVLKKPILYFSSGMKQRLKLCYSILSNVPLSILDEPLTNLDNKGIDLFNLLIKENQHSKCFIVASNREDEYHFCKHSFTIDNQKLIVRNN